MHEVEFVSVRTMEVSSKFTGNRVDENNTTTTYCLLIVAVVLQGEGRRELRSLTPQPVPPPPGGFHVDINGELATPGTPAIDGQARYLKAMKDPS